MDLDRRHAGGRRLHAGRLGIPVTVSQRRSNRFQVAMGETFIRFIVGGLFVSAFAVLGDILKPKSFAGLFGAAPSVALATLVLTIHSQGRFFAAAEARSMIFGAIAFFVYACAVCQIIMRYKLSASIVASASILIWLVVAFGLETAIDR
jgi:uncharacterized membrane protein (GlpM family)